MNGRGDEAPEPAAWLVRAADRQAFQGWQQLLTTAAEDLDLAWAALVRSPPHIDRRQHRLKGALGVVNIAGAALEQWQYEVPGGGRIWYAIDDQQHTIWITRTSTGNS